MMAHPDKVKQFADAFQKDRSDPRIEPYSTIYADSLLSGGKKFAGREFTLCQMLLQELAGTA